MESTLRQRGQEKGLPIHNGELNSHGEHSSGQSEEHYQRRQAGPWTFLPACAVLAALLFVTLYLLTSEHSQGVAKSRTISELKTQIRELKDQIATARHSKSWGDDDASSFLLQSTVKKAEQEVEKLRGDTYETNKKLQEMINRVAQLQLERGKLMHQIQTLSRDKRELAARLGETSEAEEEEDQNAL